MKRAGAKTKTEPASDARTPLPEKRWMTVIAQDPAVLKEKGGPILTARIAVPAEDLTRGPLGYRVQVVDFDASSQRFHGQHALPESYDREPETWRKGHPSIVDDFRFHAQNVYALVMNTLARFEFALGRRVGWSFATHQLKVAPHGMMDANAFYSPQEEGLVFGYFPGRTRRARRGARPAKPRTIYTCLSHDIVVHETTHALIDALRDHYLDPSSPDQGAFHEGYSDVVALLSVFSQPEIVRRLLTPSVGSQQLISRKRVTVAALRESALFGLAKQMGEELQNVRGAALRRSTTLPRDPKLRDDPEFLEPHRRGEILVAAIMNGFIEAWAARIARATVPGQTQYPLQWVVEEGAVIADTLATLWIRALDYMPPVHITFSDVLSAAITADTEVRPDDTRLELRAHMLASFKSFGIAPASTTGEVEGAWKRAPEGLSYDRVRFESMRSDRDEVFRFLWENRKLLGLSDGPFTKVLSVRPCTRIGHDGFTLHETVAVYYQVARLTPKELEDHGIELPGPYVKELEDLHASRTKSRAKRAKANGDDPAVAEPPLHADADPDDDDDVMTTPVYGGGVLIFDEYGRLKFHVKNDIFHGELQAKRLEYLWESGQLSVLGDGVRLRAARLSTLHRLRAIDARRYPAEGW